MRLRGEVVTEVKTVMDIHFPGVDQSSIPLESAAPTIKIIYDAAENSSGWSSLSKIIALRVFQMFQRVMSITSILTLAGRSSSRAMRHGCR